MAGAESDTWPTRLVYGKNMCIQCFSFSFFHSKGDIQPERSSFMKKAIVCLDDDVIQMIIGFGFCSSCKNRNSLYMEILEFLQMWSFKN